MEQMEKSLSAAQRDKLLMTEYKNDIQNKKELLNVIREGNIAFTNAADKISDAMNKMSDAFVTIANSFAGSEQSISSPPDANSLCQQHFTHTYREHHRHLCQSEITCAVFLQFKKTMILLSISTMIKTQSTPFCNHFLISSDNL